MLLLEVVVALAGLDNLGEVDATACNKHVLVQPGSSFLDVSNTLLVLELILVNGKSFFIVINLDVTLVLTNDQRVLIKGKDLPHTIFRLNEVPLVIALHRNLNEIVATTQIQFVIEQECRLKFLSYRDLMVTSEVVSEKHVNLRVALNN